MGNKTSHIFADLLLLLNVGGARHVAISKQKLLYMYICINFFLIAITTLNSHIYYAY